MKPPMMNCELIWSCHGEASSVGGQIWTSGNMNTTHTASAPTTSFRRRNTSTVPGVCGSNTKLILYFLIARLNQASHIVLLTLNKPSDNL
ncbi:unnamed protein product [Prunus armeniaca]|uniref:Uncharacterized protein n=1 Tax=Prunus armeniaca TaxID=36596 RepID=A0A6J5VQC0_PRUAR|nr:unnamed protein product [Prunus armeniaca]